MMVSHYEIKVERDEKKVSKDEVALDWTAQEVQNFLNSKSIIIK